MKHDAQLDREVLAHFLLGFHGTSLPTELRELLSRGLAGVALYPRNYESVEGLRALSDEIRAAAGGPVLIGIDQEGGTKFSLPEPFTQWPSPAELGAIGDPGLVKRIANAMARELRAVGVNLNFAPMLDLHTNPESPVTRGRSFGGNAHHVARLGAAFVEGLWSDGGVLACAKHFPGHGDAQVDPHEDLPVFRGDLKQLHRRELVPFSAAIEAGAQAIMTAHILMPAIDESRPTSLSRRLLSDVLRKALHFDGVIFADDLGMGAIRRRFGVNDAAVAALQAESDIVMLCHDWSLVAPVIETVGRAVRHDLIPTDEWYKSGGRILALRQAAEHLTADAERESLSVIGCAEHRALAEHPRWYIKEKQLPPGDLQDST
jgi:beta-N-acetylhexosaminidase